MRFLTQKKELANYETGACYPVPDAMTVTSCNADNGDLQITIRFQETKINFIFSKINFRMA